MKKDITTRADIEMLVDQFYSKIKADPVIGFIFTDVAHVQWDVHLPKMYDFFENLLFYTGSYTGNPMMLHQQVNRRFPLTSEHFKQWLLMFNTTVDELYQGANADLAKQRAYSIATVIQIKIIEETKASGKSV